MNEINKNIIEAVDTIITSRLHDLAFDNTIICEIKSIDDVDKTKYTVSTNSSSFTAYSNNKYSVGQKVYVIIPQNNYSLKKIILGSYTAEDTTPYEYISPFERLVDITGNLVVDDSQLLTIEANGEEEITTERIQLDLSKFIVPSESFGSVNYIGLKVTFTTLMPMTSKGRYGIKLTLIDISNKKHEYVFDSTELYGNPYFYDRPGFNHEKIFAIPKTQGLKEGYIELYQSGLNTFDYLSKAQSRQIKASNFYLCFGYDQSTFKEASFAIATNSSPEYSVSGDNTKDIKATYVKFDEELKRYTPQEIEPNQINWFRYRLGNNNVGGGNHWEALYKLSQEGEQWIEEASGKTKLQRAVDINKELSLLKDMELNEDKMPINFNLYNFSQEWINGYVINSSWYNEKRALKIGAQNNKYHTKIYSFPQNDNYYVALEDSNKIQANIKFSDTLEKLNHFNIFICKTTRDNGLETSRPINEETKTFEERFIGQQGDNDNSTFNGLVELIKKVNHVDDVVTVDLEKNNISNFWYRSRKYILFVRVCHLQVAHNHQFVKQPLKCEKIGLHFALLFQI